MGTIKSEHIEFLNAHRSLYESIMKAGYCRNYTKEIFVELSEIHLLYIGKHNLNHWCSECRIQLVRQVYRWYESLSDQLLADTDKEMPSDISEEDQPIKKKRGRKKKSE